MGDDAILQLVGDGVVFSLSEQIISGASPPRRWWKFGRPGFAKVIAGGQDGRLITISRKGQIHVSPPEGPLPTDQVREAVGLIFQGVELLAGSAQNVSADTALNQDG